ncbi:hypothetical protein BN1723_019111, partial [Verticillium longisporum]
QHVRRAADALGPDAQRRPLVVLFRGNVRLVPRLLPRRLLAPPRLVRRRPRRAPARPAPRRPDPAARRPRHLQALPVPRRRVPLRRRRAALPPRLPPHALPLCHRLGHPLRLLPRPRLLSPVDLRRQRQRELLLRHHPRLEPRAEPARQRPDLCHSARRVGGRPPRDGRQGGPSDL